LVHGIPIDISYYGPVCDRRHVIEFQVTTQIIETRIFITGYVRFRVQHTIGEAHDILGIGRNSSNRIQPYTNFILSNPLPGEPHIIHYSHNLRYEYLLTVQDGRLESMPNDEDRPDRSLSSIPVFAGNPLRWVHIQSSTEINVFELFPGWNISVKNIGTDWRHYIVSFTKWLMGL
jgi:hypothetical protein